MLKWVIATIKGGNREEQGNLSGRPYPDRPLTHREVARSGSTIEKQRMAGSVLTACLGRPRPREYLFRD